MSSAVDKGSSPRRRHDAGASRRCLLDAARALFEERGYDRATVRDIGERAGIDPALIARYFGGKEGLYLAALAEDERPPPSGDPASLAAQLLHHWDTRGQSPVTRALVSTAPGEASREQARVILGERLLAPLAGELRARGIADPELRAELLVAVLAGIALTRASGMLSTLAGADLSAVLDLLGPYLDDMDGERETASAHERTLKRTSS